MNSYILKDGGPGWDQMKLKTGPDWSHVSCTGPEWNLGPGEGNSVFGPPDGWGSLVFGPPKGNSTTLFVGPPENDKPELH